MPIYVAMKEDKVLIVHGILLKVYVIGIYVIVAILGVQVILSSLWLIGPVMSMVVYIIFRGIILS